MSGHSGQYHLPSLSGWVPSTDFTLAACTLSMGWREEAAAREHGDHKQRRPGGNFHPSSRRGTQRPGQAAGIGAATSVLPTPAPSSHLTRHSTASHLDHHVKSLQTEKRLPVYWETRVRDKICRNDKSSHFSACHKLRTHSLWQISGAPR